MFRYLCISCFSKMPHCVLTLFTLLKVIKAQEENQVLLQVIPSVGTEGELQILGRSVRVFLLTSLRSDFCHRYSQAKESLQKDQGQQRQGRRVYEVEQLFLAAVHCFRKQQVKIELIPYDKLFQRKKKERMLPACSLLLRNQGRKQHFLALYTNSKQAT